MKRGPAINYRTVASGLLSYVPGVMPLYRRLAFRPNPAPAEASYGIWLKHLVLSHNARDRRPPRIVAELGPGLSLGVGLAALICGAERYVALDIVRFAPMASVLPIFERLLGLFTARAKPENAHGFPPYDTLLDASGFPSEILPDARVAALLAPARIEALRRDVQGFVASGGKPSRRLHYAAPWRLADTPHRGEVDFLLSHTVLQHVGDIHAEWQNIGGMLR